MYELKVKLGGMSFEDTGRLVKDINKEIPKFRRGNVKKIGEMIKKEYVSQFDPSSRIVQGTYAHFIDEETFEVGVGDKPLYPVHPKGKWVPRTPSQVATYDEFGSGEVIPRPLARFTGEGIMPIELEDKTIFRFGRKAIPGKHKMHKSVEKINAQLEERVIKPGIDDLILRNLEKYKRKIKKLF